MKKRLIVLDSLRGIAVIGIAFFWHFRHFGLTGGNVSLSPYYVQFSWVYQSGWNLVHLFFVISGFVSMYVYSQNILQNNISFGNFFIRRLSRLYPLHVITLVLTSVLQIARTFIGLSPFVFSTNDAYHFFVNMFLLHGGMIEQALSFNAPSWTVSTEIVVSVIFFFILFKTTLRYAFFLIMLMLGLFIVKHDVDLPFFNGYMAQGLISFFLGCLTFKIHEVITRANDQIKNRILFVLMLFSILGILYDKLLFVFPLIVVLALHIGTLHKVLSLSPLVHIGNISYSIYLLHFPVQIIMDTLFQYFSLTPSVYSIFYFYIVFTFGLSWLSYRYIELPLKQFSSYLLLTFLR